MKPSFKISWWKWSVHIFEVWYIFRFDIWIILKNIFTLKIYPKYKSLYSKSHSIWIHSLFISWSKTFSRVPNLLWDEVFSEIRGRLWTVRSTGLRLSVSTWIFFVFELFKGVVVTFRIDLNFFSLRTRSRFQTRGRDFPDRLEFF